MKHTKTLFPYTSPVSSTPPLAELLNIPLPEDFSSLSGELPYTMTNDAMFHLVFEANREALKALVCSLLGLVPEDITSLEVTNPIELGNTVYAKDFVLDIKVQINHAAILNIEMQVVNLKFWAERSLGYLCRTFDNLNKGDDYIDTKPAIHVGILDFELFPGDTEFYATYHLANDITHQIYSDKFRLSVLQLRQQEYATEADKHHNRHLWAKFFKATTWEEVLMIAKQNSTIASAAQTIYRVTEDERLRALCEGREEGEKTHRTLVRMKDMALQELKESRETFKEQLTQKDDMLARKDDILAQKDSYIAELEAKLKQYTK